MPGAGKSTVATFLQSKGFHLITMGDIIREKAIDNNLPMDDKSLGYLMKNLRKHHGNEVVARLVMRRLKNWKILILS